MRRYTTPTHELVVEGIDLTGFDVYVTYEQGSCRKLTVRPDSISHDADTGTTTLAVSLSQLQTAQFASGKRATVQVNWIGEDGKRNATVIREVTVTANLLDEEIAYGG